MADDDEMTAHAPRPQPAEREMMPYGTAAAIATGLLTIWAVFAHLPIG